MSGLTESLASGSGVLNPTLSYGLTTVSDWSTQMPFLDLMKMSRGFMGHTSTQWSAMTTAQLEAGGYLDANGWPTSIPPGLNRIGTIWDWGGSANDPAAAASRAGVYVLEYEGTGTLQVQGAGIRILSSEPGRMIVENTTGGAMVLNITATDPAGTGDYIRNITMVAQEHEALFEMGQIFNPEWLELIQDARELRFKDWMGVDGVTSAEWADRPQVDDVNWRPVPVEIMVQLANQTGTEPWFTMPAGATEEYIRNFATYVRDNLDPRLQVHVEYSNELWNWAYPQTQWLATQVTEDWGIAPGTPAWIDYHAMLATKSALIWDEVFGANNDARLDLILGSQVVNPWMTNRLLNAPVWQSMDPNGYVAPHTVFDSLAVATYFGTATITNATLRNELVTMIHTPGVDATAWLAGRLMDPDYEASVPQLLRWCADIKAVVDQYDIDLIAYEGGSHVMHSWATGLSASDLADVQNFLIAFTRSEAMAELYNALWVGWAAISDGPFMQFADVEAPSIWGAFGLFSALGDSNPRAELLMDLNASSTAWFGTGGGAQYQQGVIEVAGDGGETLMGTQDDDFLIGGDGNDLIVAGLGDDAIAGEGGFDTLVLDGTPSDYTIVAEGNGYRLTANGISHYLRSVEAFEFEGHVVLSLADMLRITEARNELPPATNGDDALVGSAGNDSIDARNGNDSVYAGNGADVLLGNTGIDLLFGGSGQDTLNGGGRRDTLVGGAGEDMMLGGLGHDSYFVENAGDQVVELAGQGTDTVFTTINWTLADNVENLVLTGAGTLNGTGNALDNKLVGNAETNRLRGLEGDDTILGGSGNDTLDGGTGNDLMIGGLGDDLYMIDSAGDQINESAAAGRDRVHSLITYTLATNVDDLVLVGSAAINGTGNMMANLMIGNDAANILSGGIGRDTLAGGGGADTLEGGIGADVFVFDSTGGGVDTIADFSSQQGDVLRFEGLLVGTFVYRGGAAFTGGSDNSEARLAGGQLLIDSNGDGAADITLNLTGLTDPAQLTQADFVFV